MLCIIYILRRLLLLFLFVSLDLVHAGPQNLHVSSQERDPASASARAKEEQQQLTATVAVPTDAKQEDRVHLDKSNILLLGPTGSGMYMYIVYVHGNP